MHGSVARVSERENDLYLNGPVVSHSQWKDELPRQNVVTNMIHVVINKSSLSPAAEPQDKTGLYYFKNGSVSVFSVTYK